MTDSIDWAFFLLFFFFGRCDQRVRTSGRSPTDVFPREFQTHIFDLSVKYDQIIMFVRISLCLGIILCYLEVQLKDRSNAIEWTEWRGTSGFLLDNSYFEILQ